MYKLTQLSLSLAILLAGTILYLSPARADEWNKETIVTFSAPVEVPGHILSAGTYVFKLMDSQSDRNIVQIFSEDQKQLITTVMAIPDYRLETPDKTVIKLEERPAGSPEAIQSWFYPGDNYGLDFVYPKHEMQMASNTAPATPVEQPAPVTPAPATDQNSADRAAASPEPSAPEPSATGSSDQSEPAITANREEAQVTPEQPAVSTEEETRPQTLPQTAGNFGLPVTSGLSLAGRGSGSPLPQPMVVVTNPGETRAAVDQTGPVPSSPWRNSRTPLTDVRGSVDSARYRAATVRERFHHGLLAWALVTAGAIIDRLEVPRIHISVVVLEGAGEDVLRVAAGHVPGTAMPGKRGNIGIAAHRDTLFRPLRFIRIGDEITMTTPSGSYRFRVQSTEIVGPNKVRVLDPTADSELTLVTCYPFFYTGPAPKRFIVHARACWLSRGA